MLNKIKSKVFSFWIISLLTLIGSLSIQAAPLPDDTLLTINSGVTSGGACASGSCIGFKSGGGILWWPLTQGFDGGIIVGKNQYGGLQHVYDFSTWVGSIAGIDSFVFGKKLSLTTAAIFGSVSGSAPNWANLNIFNDVSCSGAACIGKTVLGTMNLAFGNVAFTLGSNDGCFAEPTSVTQCTSAQNNGIFVTNWAVNGNSYSLDYNQIVAQVDSRSFPGGNQVYLHLEGNIELPALPVYTVLGLITKTTGSPLQEQINIDIYDGNSTKWTTTTDLNGNFSLQLPNGIYSVDPKSSDDYMLLGTDGTNIIRVNDSNISKDLVATSLKVTLIGILSVNGSVLDNADLIAYDGSGAYTSTTTDQGFFKMKLLPSTFYNIQPGSGQSFVVPGGNGVINTIADTEGTMYLVLIGN